MNLSIFQRFINMECSEKKLTAANFLYFSRPHFKIKEKRICSGMIIFQRT